MVKNKPVKFYYYKCLLFRGEDNTPFNLGPLFQEIQRNYSTDEQRFVYAYNGEPSKLSYIGLPYDDHSYYQLTLERLRNYNFPVQSKLVGDSSELSLSEDEFLGEEVTALYDPENAVMMIQNNRDSLSYKAIELFLNSLLHEQTEGGVFTLSIISGNNPLVKARRLLGARNLLFKGDIQVAVVGSGPIGDLLSAIKDDVTREDADIIDVEVRITAKNKLSSSRPYIPQTIMNEVISYNDEEGIKKLYVKGRNPEGIIEAVNLIDDKFVDTFNFRFSEDNKYLSKNAVFSEMQSIYNGIGKDRIERNR
jgi:hypothetical protein